MKCDVCGFEIEKDVPEGSPHLLVITTNWPDAVFPAPPEFAGIFSFWNQRTRSYTQICGACLGDRLLDIEAIDARKP